MSAATNTINTWDIVDAIQSITLSHKFLAALKAAGLVETLRRRGPFTVFAPSDEAFEKLPRGAFDGLLKPKNKDDLVHILKYHAVDGRLSSDEFAGKKFRRKSLEGAELSLDGTAGVTVNKVKVTGSGIEVSNGVIHTIDTVLVPPKADHRQEAARLPGVFCPGQTSASAGAEKLLSRYIAFNPNLEEADLSHKFAVGQTVHFAPSRGHDAISGNYLVCHLMPASDYQDEPRYRIKNAAERHERVVTESDLKPREQTADFL